MRIYDRINASAPPDIDQKHAHIIGGGIADLSAAIAQTTAAHMSAANVTIYESLPLVGGSMDGAGNAEQGYTCRGERELEARMECLWYVCSKVPFVTGTTVVDMNLIDKAGETIVTGLTLRDVDGERRIALTRNDLVFFTNGSLTQNASLGDTHSIAPLNRDTRERGCFSLWAKLAAQR